MKNKLNPLILLCLLTASVSAQENPPPDPSYKHDIGFNTTFILEGVLSSSAQPFSLMYKKYTSANKAFRLGFSASLNLNDNDDQNAINYSEQSSGTVNLSLGMEKQKPIGKSWVWFHGADLTPFYQFQKSESYANAERYSLNEYSNFGLGLRPFLGIRYNINSRLYLSAEASLTLRYARYDQSYENFQSYINSTENSGNNFTFHASPASGLFLYYKF